MVNRLRSAAWLGVSTLLVFGCDSRTPPAVEPVRAAAGAGKVTLHVEGMADRLGLY